MAAFGSSSGAQGGEVSGGAFGYSLNVSLFGAPQPAVGPVPTVTLPPGGSATAITGTAPSGDAGAGPAKFFSSDAIDVSTEGTPGGTVKSSAKIGQINTSGQEAFTAGGLESSCEASAGGATGKVRVTEGTLMTDSGDDDPQNSIADHPPVSVDIPADPAPNTSFEGHIHVNGATDQFQYIFNEQVTNADGSITVNGGHEKILGPTAVGDLLVGQTKCAGAGGAANPTPTAAENPTPAATGTTTGGTGTGGTGMATTGTDILPLAFLGLELLVVGGLAIRWAGRRRAWPRG